MLQFTLHLYSDRGARALYLSEEIEHYKMSEKRPLLAPERKEVTKRLGPWFNIKVISYRYRKSHCGDKTVVRSSYLHNGISYTGKMTSLYWIGALLQLLIAGIQTSDCWYDNQKVCFRFSSIHYCCCWHGMAYINIQTFKTKMILGHDRSVSCVLIIALYMMTSSNGNIFRVTGPLCEEFTDHRWIPLTKAIDAELWCFLSSVPE